MKIVVIGGTGLIGSKLVEKLRWAGHEPLAASPDTGVDTLTGEGLAEALEGAEVVVDVANAPAWDDAAVLDFFQTSARNLLAAETAAGVGHHLALSIVGADRLPESGYMRAKIAQEETIKAGSVPYTILRATQFFEFIGRIADSSTNGDTIRVPPVFLPAGVGRRRRRRVGRRSQRASRRTASSSSQAPRSSVLTNSSGAFSARTTTRAR